MRNRNEDQLRADRLMGVTLCAACFCSGKGVVPVKLLFSEFSGNQRPPLGRALMVRRLRYQDRWQRSFGGHPYYSRKIVINSQKGITRNYSNNLETKVHRAQNLNFVTIAISKYLEVPL